MKKELKLEMPQLKVDDEELQAAEQAYNAYNKGYVEAVKWNQLNDTEQENWRRVVIAVTEYLELHS